MKDRAISSLWSFIEEIVRYKYFIFQIFKHNLISTYWQSFLWLFWLVIIPLFQILMFLFLKKSRVIAGDTIYLPYPLYVFFSLIIWQTFARIIRSSCNILNNYSNLQTLRFPRETIIYGATCVSLCNALLLLLLLIVVSVVYKVPPGVGIIYLPLIFFFTVLFALGLGKIVAILSAMARDISQGLGILLVCWMLATPTIYTSSSHISSKYLHVIKYLNPMYSFIETAHFLWMGEFSKITAIFYWHCLGAVVAFLIGTYFFRRSIHIVLEHI